MTTAIMSTEKKSDVEETCDQLEKVHLQLKVIQERNAEILRHLAEAQALAVEDDVTLPPQLTQSISKAEDISKKVDETVDSQCCILNQSVQELRRIPTDSESRSSSEENSIQYQLRSQLDRNVILQKEKAELELHLAEKLKAINLSQDKNSELEQELESTKDSLQKLVESYEENATKAEEQLKKLEEDLKKSQEKGKEYNSLLKSNSKESAKKSNKTPSESVSGKNGSRATAAHSTATSLPNPSDIDDRYMSLLEENRRQREEIQRLKAENTYLIKQNKQATTDMDMMQKHVATCTAQRQEMQIRLKRQQEEHQRLAKSLTKQAADWINEKKTIKETESTNRMKKIGAI